MAQIDRDIDASVGDLVFDLSGGGRALFTDRARRQPVDARRR